LPSREETFDVSPRQFVEPIDGDDAGIVHHAVKRSEALDRHPYSTLGGSRFRYIYIYGCGGDAGGTELMRGISPSRHCTLGDDDGPAGLTKGLGGGKSDPASGASDQCDASRSAGQNRSPNVTGK
jgi:hypothetical protein